MKRALFVAFSILMLCSLLLLITVGTTMAGDPDYSYIEYDAQVAATLDGVWTSDDEWTDGPVITVSENVSFTGVINLATTAQENLIEFFTDNTNDTGDYWQICIDSANDGGTAPDDDDWRIEVVGHTTLMVYQGTGTGWTEVTPDVGEILWADSISASPWNSTPHWIFEFHLEKMVGIIMPPQPPNGLRVACYDASNSEAGVQAWAPDSERDVPEGWGLISAYGGGPIPEGLTIGVMVLLSSVSVLIASHYFRKRSSSGKREK
jgi:hypothetical protein